MSIPPGRFVCPLCEQDIGPAEVPYLEEPVCASPKHLKRSTMVLIAATAAERQRKSRRARRKVTA